MDTTKRTIAKAILWTLIGLISMTLTGFWITGSMQSGGALALMNTGLGLVSYIVYERIWGRVRWGRIG